MIYLVVGFFLSPYSSLASGLRGRALRKIEYFPLRTKSCLSVASSFRLGKCDDFLALERQPALFLFVSFSFVRTKGKRKTLQLEQKNFNYQNLSFTYLFFLSQKEKVNPCQNVLWAG